MSEANASSRGGQAVSNPWFPPEADLRQECRGEYKGNGSMPDQVCREYCGIDCVQ